MASSFDVVPSTLSVKATLDFITPYLDEPTYNHVIRSSIFANILAKNISTNPINNLECADTEIITIACLLHDMSWNPLNPKSQKFISKDRRFEVDGAYAARDFLHSLPKDYGWNERRIQLVWDAIALHTTRSIAWHKESEVILSQYGITCDIIGIGEGKPPLPSIDESRAVSQEQYNKIYQDYPSLKLANYVKGALCALCREKPESTYDNFVSEYGEEYVEGYSLKGKRVVDLMKFREQAENAQEE